MMSRCLVVFLFGMVLNLNGMVSYSKKTKYDLVKISSSTRLSLVVQERLLDIFVEPIYSKGMSFTSTFRDKFLFEKAISELKDFISKSKKEINKLLDKDFFGKQDKVLFQLHIKDSGIRNKQLEKIIDKVFKDKEDLLVGINLSGSGNITKEIYRFLPKNIKFLSFGKTSEVQYFDGEKLKRFLQGLQVEREPVRERVVKEVYKARHSYAAKKLEHRPKKLKRFFQEPKRVLPTREKTFKEVHTKFKYITIAESLESHKIAPQYRHLAISFHKKGFGRDNFDRLKEELKFFVHLSKQHINEKFLLADKYLLAGFKKKEPVLFYLDLKENESITNKQLGEIIGLFADKKNRLYGLNLLGCRKLRSSIYSSFPKSMKYLVDIFRTHAGELREYADDDLEDYLDNMGLSAFSLPFKI